MQNSYLQSGINNIGKQSKANNLAMGVLISLSICHCCNDALQAVLSSLYPMIKSDLALNFIQIGFITFIYQLVSSVFQPLVGWYLDNKPNPWFITLAAFFTFSGLVVLAYANTIVLILISVFFIGLGSAIIHPEASRLTSLASGGRRGLAQSIFQVGGNFGGSLGPLLAALVIAPYGRENAAIVAFLAFGGVVSSVFVARWYKRRLKENSLADKLSGPKKKVKKGDPNWIPRPLSDRKTYFVISVLLVLIFSKYIYMSSITSYYTFYLIDKFGLSVQYSQYALFVFLFATALGTMLGGPIGDKIGRKYVIWVSILGTAPFSLLMPYAGLGLTILISFLVGFMLSSAFPAIILYAQELLPNRIGMISGLFFGFSFGIAGIAAALWGAYAESHGVGSVFNLSAYFPLLGVVAALLPNIEAK